MKLPGSLWVDSIHVEGNRVLIKRRWQQFPCMEARTDNHVNGKSVSLHTKQLYFSSLLSSSVNRKNKCILRTNFNMNHSSNLHAVTEKEIFPHCPSLKWEFFTFIIIMFILWIMCIFVCVFFPLSDNQSDDCFILTLCSAPD